MATGTIIYNKDRQLIYPISDASVITYEKSTVEKELLELWDMIGKLTNSDETISTIIIEVSYLPANTTNEAEIKESTRLWSDRFELPTEENPYVWKRTTFTYKGADTGQTIYEIVASDISTIILTIYTRTEGITPVIEYKLKVDEDGNLLYIDGQGLETTEVTTLKAYDYDYYFNGLAASGLNNLPPTPEGYSYTWTDYPQDISPSYTSVFMSRRIRLGGKWFPFSTPAQYGLWYTGS